MSLNWSCLSMILSIIFLNDTIHATYNILNKNKHIQLFAASTAATIFAPTAAMTILAQETSTPVEGEPLVVEQNPEVTSEGQPENVRLEESIDQANKDLEQAKNEESAAKENMDNAQADLDRKEEVLDQVKKDYKDTYPNLIEAENKQDTLEEDMKAASEALNKAEEQVNKAQQAVKHANQTQDKAQQDYDKALEDAKSQHRQSLQEALDQAMSQEKTGSLGFFEWIRDTYPEYATDANNAISALLDDKGEGTTHIGAKDDATYLPFVQQTIKIMNKTNELRIQNGLKPMNVSLYKGEGTTHIGAKDDATYLPFVQQTIKIMNKTNELRIQNGLKPMNVSLYAMAAAQKEVNWRDEDIFNPRLYKDLGHNPLWGFEDYFDGWYYEEKSEYDQLIREGKTDEWIRENKWYDMGYYLNLMDPSYNSMGFAINYNSDYGYNGEAYVQTFSYKDGSMTVNQFASLLEGFGPGLKENIAKAKEALKNWDKNHVSASNDIEKDPRVQAAKSALDKAKAARGEADLNLTMAIGKMQAAKEAYEKAKAALDDFTPYFEALIDVEDARQTLKSATVVWNKAAAVVAEKQAVVDRLMDKLSTSLKSQEKPAESIKDAAIMAITTNGAVHLKRHRGYSSCDWCGRLHDSRDCSRWPGSHDR